MTKDVCPDDCEAYRLFGSPDELSLEAMVEGLKIQYWAHDHPEEMPDEYRERSLGVTAWEVIGFALERGWPIPDEAFRYLKEVAKNIDDWAIMNRHPAELKDILSLQGKRKVVDQKNDPRWIFSSISQMKANRPSRSIKDLVREFLHHHPKLDYTEEAIRQKYYEGKKLAETGQDYKGRDRKRELRDYPPTASWEEIEF